MLAIFFLGFFLSVVVALSQDAPNQAPKTPADIGARLTTIMGTVQGHEGHYVHMEGYAYPDMNLIYITEVKIPTAREARIADIK